MFSGNKTKFEYSSTTFQSIVDDSDEITRYQMIWLKSCLHGKAEESISKLSFSDEVYKEAKILSNKGLEVKKRRLQNYLKELKKIKFIQEGNVQELDKFADSLVKTVVTPHEL